MPHLSDHVVTSWTTVFQGKGIVAIVRLEQREERSKQLQRGGRATRPRPPCTGSRLLGGLPDMTSTLPGGNIYRVSRQVWTMDWEIGDVPLGQKVGTVAAH